MAISWRQILNLFIEVDMNIEITLVVISCFTTLDSERRRRRKKKKKLVEAIALSTHFTMVFFNNISLQ
jgi:hypothetical protein